MNRDYETLVDALPDGTKLKIVTKKNVNTKGKNIEILSGWLTDEQVREMYAKALLVVVPSRTLKNESSGLSCALQTLACKRALIISNAPPLREILHDKEDCLYYESENAEDLRGKMKIFLADEQLRVNIALHGHETVVQNWTVEMMGRRMGEIMHTG